LIDGNAVIHVCGVTGQVLKRIVSKSVSGIWKAHVATSNGGQALLCLLFSNSQCELWDAGTGSFLSAFPLGGVSKSSAARALLTSLATTAHDRPFLFSARTASGSIQVTNLLAAASALPSSGLVLNLEARSTASRKACTVTSIAVHGSLPLVAAGTSDGVLTVWYAPFLRCESTAGRTTADVRAGLRGGSGVPAAAAAATSPTSPTKARDPLANTGDAQHQCLFAAALSGGVLASGKSQVLRDDAFHPSAPSAGAPASAAGAARPSTAPPSRATAAVTALAFHPSVPVVAAADASGRVAVWHIGVTDGAHFQLAASSVAPLLHNMPQWSQRAKDLDEQAAFQTGQQAGLHKEQARRNAEATGLFGSVTSRHEPCALHFTSGPSAGLLHVLTRPRHTAHSFDAVIASVGGALAKLASLPGSKPILQRRVLGMLKQVFQPEQAKSVAGASTEGVPVGVDGGFSTPTAETWGGSYVSWSATRGHFAGDVESLPQLQELQSWLDRVTTCLAHLVPRATSLAVSHPSLPACGSPLAPPLQALLRAALQRSVAAALRAVSLVTPDGRLHVGASNSLPGGLPSASFEGDPGAYEGGVDGSSDSTLNVTAPAHGRRHGAYGRSALLRAAAALAGMNSSSVGSGWSKGGGAFLSVAASTSPHFGAPAHGSGLLARRQFLEGTPQAVLRSMLSENTETKTAHMEHGRSPPQHATSAGSAARLHLHEQGVSAVDHGDGPGQVPSPLPQAEACHRGASNEEPAAVSPACLLVADCTEGPPVLALAFAGQVFLLKQELNTMSAFNPRALQCAASGVPAAPSCSSLPWRCPTQALSGGNLLPLPDGHRWSSPGGSAYGLPVVMSPRGAPLGTFLSSAWEGLPLVWGGVAPLLVPPPAASGSSTGASSTQSTLAKSSSRIGGLRRPGSKPPAPPQGQLQGGANQWHSGLPDWYCVALSSILPATNTPPATADAVLAAQGAPLLLRVGVQAAMWASAPPSLGAGPAGQWAELMRSESVLKLLQAAATTPHVALAPSSMSTQQLLPAAAQGKIDALAAVLEGSAGGATPHEAPPQVQYCAPGPYTCAYTVFVQSVPVVRQAGDGRPVLGTTHRLLQRPAEGMNTAAAKAEHEEAQQAQKHASTLDGATGLAGIAPPRTPIKSQNSASTAPSPTDAGRPHGDTASVGGGEEDDADEGEPVPVGHVSTSEHLAWLPSVGPHGPLAPLSVLPSPDGRFFAVKMQYIAAQPRWCSGGDASENGVDTADLFPPCSALLGPVAQEHSVHPGPQALSEGPLALSSAPLYVWAIVGPSFNQCVKAPGSDSGTLPAGTSASVGTASTPDAPPPLQPQPNDAVLFSYSAASERVHDVSRSGIGGSLPRFAAGGGGGVEPPPTVPCPGPWPVAPLVHATDLAWASADQLCIVNAAAGGLPELALHFLQADAAAYLATSAAVSHHAAGGCGATHGLHAELTAGLRTALGSMSAVDFSGGASSCPPTAGAVVAFVPVTLRAAGVQFIPRTVAHVPAAEKQSHEPFAQPSSASARSSQLVSPVSRISSAAGSRLASPEDPFSHTPTVGGQDQAGVGDDFDDPFASEEPLGGGTAPATPVVAAADDPFAGGDDPFSTGAAAATAAAGADPFGVVPVAGLGTQGKAAAHPQDDPFAPAPAQLDTASPPAVGASHLSVRTADATAAATATAAPQFEVFAVQGTAVLSFSVPCRGSVFRVFNTPFGANSAGGGASAQPILLFETAAVVAGRVVHELRYSPCAEQVLAPADGHSVPSVEPSPELLAAAQDMLLDGSGGVATTYTLAQMAAAGASNKGIASGMSGDTDLSRDGTVLQHLSRQLCDSVACVPTGAVCVLDPALNTQAAASASTAAAASNAPSVTPMKTTQVPDAMMDDFFGLGLSTGAVAKSEGGEGGGSAEAAHAAAVADDEDLLGGLDFFAGTGNATPVSPQPFIADGGASDDVFHDPFAPQAAGAAADSAWLPPGSNEPPQASAKPAAGMRFQLRKGESVLQVAWSASDQASQGSCLSQAGPDQPKGAPGCLPPPHQRARAGCTVQEATARMSHLLAVHTTERLVILSPSLHLLGQLQQGGSHGGLSHLNCKEREAEHTQHTAAHDAFAQAAAVPQPPPTSALRVLAVDGVVAGGDAVSVVDRSPAAAGASTAQAKRWYQGVHTLTQHATKMHLPGCAADLELQGPQPPHWIVGGDAGLTGASSADQHLNSHASGHHMLQIPQQARVDGAPGSLFPPHQIVSMAWAGSSLLVGFASGRVAAMSPLGFVMDVGSTFGASQPVLSAVLPDRLVYFSCLPSATPLVENSALPVQRTRAFSPGVALVLAEAERCALLAGLRGHLGDTRTAPPANHHHPDGLTQPALAAVRQAAGLLQEVAHYVAVSAVAWVKADAAVSSLTSRYLHPHAAGGGGSVREPPPLHTSWVPEAASTMSHSIVERLLALGRGAELVFALVGSVSDADHTPPGAAGVFSGNVYAGKKQLEGAGPLGTQHTNAPDMEDDHASEGAALPAEVLARLDTWGMPRRGQGGQLAVEVCLRLAAQAHASTVARDTWCLAAVHCALADCPSLLVYFRSALAAVRSALPPQVWAHIAQEGDAGNMGHSSGAQMPATLQAALRSALASAVQVSSPFSVSPLPAPGSGNAKRITAVGEAALQMGAAHVARFAADLASDASLAVRATAATYSPSVAKQGGAAAALPLEPLQQLYKRAPACILASLTAQVLALEVAGAGALSPTAGQVAQAAAGAAHDSQAHTALALFKTTAASHHASFGSLPQRSSELFPSLLPPPGCIAAAQPPASWTAQAGHLPGVVGSHSAAPLNPLAPSLLVPSSSGAAAILPLASGTLAAFLGTAVPQLACVVGAVLSKAGGPSAAAATEPDEGDALMARYGLGAAAGGGATSEGGRAAPLSQEAKAIEALAAAGITFPTLPPLGMKDEDKVLAYWRFENRVMADAAAAKAAEGGAGMGRRRRRRRRRRADSDGDSDNSDDGDSGKNPASLPPPKMDLAVLPIRDLAPGAFHGSLVCTRVPALQGGGGAQPAEGGSAEGGALGIISAAGCMSVLPSLMTCDAPYDYGEPGRVQEPRCLTVVATPPGADVGGEEDNPTTVWALPVPTPENKNTVVAAHHAVNGSAPGDPVVQSSGPHETPRSAEAAVAQGLAALLGEAAFGSGSALAGGVVPVRRHSALDVGFAPWHASSGSWTLEAWMHIACSRFGPPRGDKEAAATAAAGVLDPGPLSSSSVLACRLGPVGEAAATGAAPGLMWALLVTADGRLQLQAQNPTGGCSTVAESAVGAVRGNEWRHVAVTVAAPASAVTGGLQSLKASVSSTTGKCSAPVLARQDAITATLALDGEEVGGGACPATAPAPVLSDAAPAALRGGAAANGESPQAEMAADVALSLASGGCLLLAPNAVGMRLAEVRLWSHARSLAQVSDAKDFALDLAEERQTKFSVAMAPALAQSSGQHFEASAAATAARRNQIPSKPPGLRALPGRRGIQSTKRPEGKSLGLKHP